MTITPARYTAPLRPRRIAGIREKADVRMQNIRFQRAVRAARDRETLRTEHAVMNNLLYTQISPGLRERVLQRRDKIAGLLET